MRKTLLMVCLLLSGCVSIPEGIEPVTNFDLQRYLGKWYEVARLDHSFERGLDGVTAEYSLRDDGGVKVINSGFNAAKSRWQSAEGRAYFVDNTTVGHLKVSFFGPFYGSYIIFHLDENYQYSMITSTDKSYFWLLSRHPHLEPKVRTELIQKAQALGFKTDQFIYVEPIEAPL